MSKFLGCHSTNTWRAGIDHKKIAIPRFRRSTDFKLGRSLEQSLILSRIKSRKWKRCNRIMITVERKNLLYLDETQKVLHDPSFYKVIARIDLKTTCFFLFLAQVPIACLNVINFYTFNFTIIFCHRQAPFFPSVFYCLLYRSLTWSLHTLFILFTYLYINSQVLKSMCV